MREMLLALKEMGKTILVGPFLHELSLLCTRIGIIRSRTNCDRRLAQ